MLWIQVLNRKLNHLNISEFTAKLYAPFKSKEEDMKNAAKTAMLLVKLVFLLWSTSTVLPSFLMSQENLLNYKKQFCIWKWKLPNFQTFLNSFPSTHYRDQSFSYLFIRKFCWIIYYQCLTFNGILIFLLTPAAQICLWKWIFRKHNKGRLLGQVCRVC